MREKPIYSLGLQTSEGVVGFTMDLREKLPDFIHQDMWRVVHAAKGVEDRYGKQSFGPTHFARRDPTI
ncbi:MAG: hypothetical protein A2900_02885 [Candidatus Chisholmbacteria bacterium RIFCSPLOWO2_01_FULL_50_28]|uniref:Uncharacterized protein n=1 Tax=Candidatus Chisholmbacteria bacterium RIFCSPHIGHO2_01_FULL_52_32 TaxID=1797591 RepID=A0A1G1VT79_9BACT|nr:MAG: hypothetical protein A2786_03860 [Candidatus Chisholmbacteria bacterium RIFCSPHIGHO2_01_FULL_52_32]OGY20023.1 MAG: hypothetical protein A2900_02885 [Candidatus Chisholmbacteria bacterium RIFCSPLOWO2_01_FULL_50_28]